MKLLGLLVLFAVIVGIKSYCIGQENKHTVLEAKFRTTDMPFVDVASFIRK